MTPDSLGKYEVRSTLGRGAMGVVYEGWDPVISRRVAIKTVRLPDPSDAEAQEELSRFKREAQAAGRLNHPNVVGVFDYNETAELAYIVMEFVEGRSLKGMVDEQQRMALPIVGRVLSDILDGLAYCHERGVVHRDIKPANIMITPEGQAKIADFGIARIESSSMTQAGTVLGTPAFMSPEQFMGVIVDARTDIYSTGVLLFQLLTGERPFEGSMTTIMHKVLNTVPPKPSDLAITAPRSLDDVVARAMARRPEDRFPTAGAFKQAMQAALAAPDEDPLGRAPLLPAQEDGTIVMTAPRPKPAAAATRPAPAAAAPPPAAPAKAKRSSVPLLAGIAAIVVIGGGGAAYVLTRPAEPVTGTVAGQVSPPVATNPTTTAANGTTGSTSAPANATSANTAPTTSTQATTTSSTQRKPDLPPIQNVAPVSPPDPAAVRQPPPPTTTSTAALTTAPVQLVTPTQSALVANQPPVATTTTSTKPPPTTTVPTQTASVVATTPAEPSVVASSPTTTTTTTPTSVAPTVAPPTQTAMLTPAMMRPALAQALAATPCSFTTGGLPPTGGATVRGVASGPALGEMRESAEGATPGLAIDWGVTAIDDQFCPVLDLIHGLAPEFGSQRAVTLTLDNLKTKLVTDEFIIPHVAMPPYPAYLNVDYFVHDGTVLHLFPTDYDPSARDARRQFPARTTVEMGKAQPQKGFPGWQIDEPYGQDLIVVTASSVPLIGIRPVDKATQNEPTGPYLAALKAAIDSARRRDAKVSADALVLETAKKP
jgi:serine/threonine protein kinase